MSTTQRLLIALGLSIVAILAIEVLLPPPPRPPAAPAPTTPGPKAPPTPAPAPAADGSTPAPAPAPATPGEPGPANGAPAPAKVEEPTGIEDLPFSSGRLRSVIRSRGASLGRTWIRGIAARPGSDPGAEAGALRFLEDAPADGPGALGVTLVSRHQDVLQLHDLEKRNWDLVSRDGGSLWRARALAEEKTPGRGIVVEKRFLPSNDPGAFHLRMEVSVTNDDPDLKEFDLGLAVRGAALVHGPEGTRDLLYGRAKVRNTASPLSVTGHDVEERPKSVEPRDLEWAASATTYFAAILDPDELEPGQAAPLVPLRWDGLRPPPRPDGPKVPAQPSPVLTIPVPGGVPAPGERKTLAFTFFVGPTANAARLEGEDRPVLDREEYVAYKPARTTSWLPIEIISQVLFYLLKGFHTLVGSWGASIVLLTVLVRGLMFPLSRKQMKSTIEYSKKMQKVKPKLDALREKHGNDKQRMAQEQMRLWKEHEIPILPGGCLLTFLQLPIWIALYGMLQSNFDLRHASFLWIRDLSQPEHIVGGEGAWASIVRSVFFIPNAFMYLNVLPLLMTATWFFASKATMTPPADEQQAQMQAMMQWMPFVMLLLPGFYDMPAGLCLYITASSTWGIVESRIIRKKYA